MPFGPLRTRGCGAIFFPILVLLSASAATAASAAEAEESTPQRDCVVPFTECDGALVGSQQCSEQTVGARGGGLGNRKERPAVLLLDSTFNELTGICDCKSSTVKDPASEDAMDLEDLRRWDWVVFGLVDRPEFILQHSSCPFVMPGRDGGERGLEEEDCRELDGNGTCAAHPSRELVISAVVVTDRALSRNITTASLDALRASPYLAGSRFIRIAPGAPFVAWLLEPPAVAGDVYRYIEAHHDDYDLVFTHVLSLEIPKKKLRHVPLGSSLIPASLREIHTKTRLASIIISLQNSAEGHFLRRQVAELIGCEGYTLHCYGAGAPLVQAGGEEGEARGGGRFKSKIGALREYMFSVVIENSKYEGYFTEKIIDAFLTGTVPIYWGSDPAKAGFDLRGIIQVNTAVDVASVMERIQGEKGAAVYESMRDAIERNFEAAKRYLDPLGVGVWEGGLAELVEERWGNQGLGMGLTVTGIDGARGDNEGALTDGGGAGDRPVSGGDSDVGQGAVVVIVSVDVRFGEAVRAIESCATQDAIKTGTWICLVVVSAENRGETSQEIGHMSHMLNEERHLRDSWLEGVQIVDAPPSWKRGVGSVLRWTVDEGLLVGNGGVVWLDGRDMFSTASSLDVLASSLVGEGSEDGCLCVVGKRLIYPIPYDSENERRLDRPSEDLIAWIKKTDDGFALEPSEMYRKVFSGMMISGIMPSPVIAATLPLLLHTMRHGEGKAGSFAVHQLDPVMKDFEFAAYSVPLLEAAGDRVCFAKTSPTIYDTSTSQRVLGALVGEARMALGGMLFNSQERRGVSRMVPVARRPCHALSDTPVGVEFADMACTPRKMHLIASSADKGSLQLRFWCTGLWFPEESRGIAVEINGVRAFGPNDFMQNGETRNFMVDGLRPLDQDRLAEGRVSVEAWGVDWHTKEIPGTRGSWFFENLVN